MKNDRDVSGPRSGNEGGEPLREVTIGRRREEDVTDDSGRPPTGPIAQMLMDDLKKEDLSTSTPPIC